MSEKEPETYEIAMNDEELEEAHQEKIANIDNPQVEVELRQKYPDIPKSRNSMFLMDATIISENNRKYQENLVQAYKTPEFALVLGSLCRSTWSLIKHGFAEQGENYTYMKSRVAVVDTVCQQLGDILANENQKVDRESYHVFLTQINEVWDDIMSVRAAMALCIRFERKDAAMKILHDHSRNPTAAIEQEE